MLKAGKNHYQKLQSLFIMNVNQNNTYIARKPFFALLTGILIFSITGLSGQVQFKLDKLSDGETYQVSLVPMKTWASPMNITSTAQVTLKVPTNSFEISELVSVQPDVNWEYNSKSVSPDEAPQYDYLSIGLSSMGTKQLHYKKGVAVPLFTFKNGDICQGSIQLMSSNDPFKTPNSKRANVGNSITVFGAKGEAFQRDFSSKVIPCNTEVPLQVTKPAALVETKPSVYPNPAINQVFVEMQWQHVSTEGEMVILDMNGREVSKQTVNLQKGKNKMDLNVKNLPSGLFSIELRYQDQTMVLDRFVKQNR